MKNVVKSFDCLYQTGMITSSGDSGRLTALGRFAGQLPCDLQLGRMVALGIAMNITREAAIMAAAISQPKTIFRIAAALIHTDPDEYNEIVRSSLSGSFELDGGVYSEPIMYLRVYELYSSLPVLERDRWIRAHGLVHARLHSFMQSATNMLRVTKAALESANQHKSAHATQWARDLDLHVSSLGSAHFTSQKLLFLRLLLAWTSEGNVINIRPPKTGHSENVDHVIVGQPILDKTQLESIFGPKSGKFRWEAQVIGRRIYDAPIVYWRSADDLTKRLIAIVTNINDSPRPPLFFIHDCFGHLPDEGLIANCIDSVSQKGALTFNNIVYIIFMRDSSPFLRDALYRDLQNKPLRMSLLDVNVDEIMILNAPSKSNLRRLVSLNSLILLMIQ